MSVLTLLICVVVAAGDGPIEGGGGEPETYLPTDADLREVGVITDEFPVPGALPPELFPADAWGISPPGPPAWLPWALVGLVLLWVGVRLAREPAAWPVARPRRRLRAAPEPEAPEDDAVVARRAVDAALAPLREPTDPRAAVIEAYARLEEVVGQRRSGEAPREYLSRVLVEQRVPEGSLTALTELFEEARFSRHPIGASASERAAGELRAVRSALATGSSDPR